MNEQELRNKIAQEVADKMDYMNTCLNERNIILGIITGKREHNHSLCNECRIECSVHNETKAKQDTHLQRHTMHAIISSERGDIICRQRA